MQQWHAVSGKTSNLWNYTDRSENLHPISSFHIQLCTDHITNQMKFSWHRITQDYKSLLGRENSNNEHCHISMGRLPSHHCTYIADAYKSKECTQLCHHEKLIWQPEIFCLEIMIALAHCLLLGTHANHRNPGSLKKSVNIEWLKLDVYTSIIKTISLNFFVTHPNGSSEQAYLSEC